MTLMFDNRYLTFIEQEKTFIMQYKNTKMNTVNSSNSVLY